MAESPLTRPNLQVLAESRLTEARILNSNGQHDGAVYLAGYALEFALKARVCKILDSDYPVEFRCFLTHKIQELVKLAGLEKQLNQQRALDLDFGNNWSVVVGASASMPQGWSEKLRYRKIGSATAADADLFLQALDDPAAGIFTWIKKLW